MSDVDLSRLRAHFDDEVVGKLPKITCPQCSKGSCGQGHRKEKCKECGSWISTAHIHIDYVGHADVTDRILDVDPEWSWRPQATDPDPAALKAAIESGNPEIVRMVTGNAPPKFERASNGNPVGLWIWLTIGGITKPGYGSCPVNQMDPEKVLIGDCLLRGTPIQTARGIVRIEDVRVGDLVPTRAGWRRVTDHWLSHPQAPTKAVLLADGRLIVGTPHHRVPTANRGMKRIEALRNGDMLYTWPDTARTQAQTRSSGTNAATGGSLTIPTGIAAFTSWRPPHRAITCTSTSTRQRTGRSPKAGTSITATLIRLTTIPETSSPSPRRTTPSGTASIWSPTSGIAMNAASRTRQSADGAAGALLLARNAGDAGTGLLTSAPARDLSRMPASARSAEPSSPPRNHGNASALVPVVAVLDAGPGEVWNLSVEDVHEYVANGLIVSNSLRNAGMRFGIATYLWAKGERQDPTSENPAGEGGRAEQHARRPETPRGKVTGADRKAAAAPEEVADLGDWQPLIDGLTTRTECDKALDDLRLQYTARTVKPALANAVSAAIIAKAATLPAEEVAA